MTVFESDTHSTKPWKIAPVPSVMMNGSVFSLTTRKPFSTPHANPITIASRTAGTMPHPCCVFSTAITIAANAPAAAERQVEVAGHRRQQRGEGEDEQRRLGAEHAAEVPAWSGTTPAT